MDNKGIEYLYFSGTDYLGMSSNEAFEAFIIQGFRTYGINLGISRSNNVQIKALDEFEAFFSREAGAEMGLVWSSGYLAGQGTLQLLMAQADQIFVSPDTHAAVLNASLSCDNSQTFEQWKDKVKATLSELNGQRVLIISNSVNPLRPAVYDFSWVAELPDKHAYTLLLDDSHAFGVYGNRLFGTYKQWSALPVDVIVIGSLGKGLGLPAGITLGPADILKKISQDPFFRGASPPPPAYLLAFMHAQEIYREQYTLLQSNYAQFLSMIEGIHAFNFCKELPIVTFDDEEWVSILARQQIVVSSFPYPKSTDPCLNRIVINAQHQLEDLHILAKALKQLVS